MQSFRRLNSTKEQTAIFKCWSFFRRMHRLSLRSSWYHQIFFDHEICCYWYRMICFAAVLASPGQASFDMFLIKKMQLCSIDHQLIALLVIAISFEEPALDDPFCYFDQIIYRISCGRFSTSSWQMSETFLITSSLLNASFISAMLCTWQKNINCRAKIITFIEYTTYDWRLGSVILSTSSKKWLVIALFSCFVFPY